MTHEPDYECTFVPEPWDALLEVTRFVILACLTGTLANERGHNDVTTVKEKEAGTMIDWTQPCVSGYLTHEDAEDIRTQLCERLPARFVWISHNTAYANINERDVCIGSFDYDDWSHEMQQQHQPVKLGSYELSSGKSGVSITFAAAHYVASALSSLYTTQTDVLQSSESSRPPLFEFDGNTVTIWQYNGHGERIQWILKAIPEVQK